MRPSFALCFKVPSLIGQAQVSFNDEIKFHEEFLVNRTDFEVGRNSFSLSDELIKGLELSATN